MENFDILVNELRKFPNETPWVEFKHNNYDPKMIGEDISALANSAVLYERTYAYMIWGIHDGTHEAVGTDYDLQFLKKGKQELENWLRSLLSGHTEFSFEKVSIDGKKIGLLVIHCAELFPVEFEKVAYIRIGSYTKKLREYPTIQARLWEKLRNAKFEAQFAMQGLKLPDILGYLDYGLYFDLLHIPQPSNAEGIAHYLLEEGIILREDNGLYSISNMGAVLFAKRLADFERVSRKAIRVVQYRGNNRLDMLKEMTGEKGYVSVFEKIMTYIEALLPSEERIVSAKREKVTVYPALAIREAVANALIHQDFSITGTGPVVEIFESRIEITNPGIPLVDIIRIIDNPPRSRNEKLAALMRRLGMCEELGTGWDKMTIACELRQLPAPKIEVYENSTKVTIFAEIPFADLSMEERLWACYLHACVKQIQGEQLTNSSLRERFGVKTSSAGSISRLIKEAVNSELIKPVDPNTAPRYMSYIPIWA